MQINSTGYLNSNDIALDINQTITSQNKDNDELTLEEQINKSAVEVSLSMNAQIILFEMNSKDLAYDNTNAQNSILNFLSGEKVDGELSLQDIGYEGKPIIELSSDEASELVSEEGFFGIVQTSQRVAEFVFSFAGENLDILEQGREGIIQGFEDAQKMWGGELPQISYDTQAKTLEIIDAKIQAIKDTLNSEASE